MGVYAGRKDALDRIGFAALKVECVAYVERLKKAAAAKRELSSRCKSAEQEC